MAEVRLSKAAARDLSDTFFDSVEQFGRLAAEGCRDSLKRSLALLAAHPLSARARPDLGAALRSRSHGPHMIFYEVRGDIVLVVRVLHAAMDAAVHLDDHDDLADWRDMPNEGDADLQW